MNPTLAGWRTNPIIGLLSSIRFGVVMLVLILIYACIASALPQVRGALEMTEMQIFRHWVFTTLIVIFSVSLILATITRIRVSWVNAGVLTVHLGLLLLVGGSIRYFGTKTEGDTILFSPRVQLVSTAGGNQRVIAEVLAESGQSWGSFMPAFGGAVQVAVSEVNARLDGTITSAIVSAVAGGETKTLTLNEGMEIEVVPGALLARLVTDEPTSKFYDNETAALYVRRVEETNPAILPLEGLPFFRERYAQAAGVLNDTAGRAVPSKRTERVVQLAGLTLPTGVFEHWRLPIELRAAALPFDIAVDGYLPYVARLENRPVEGGAALNPAVDVGLSVGGTSIDESLFALLPARSMMPRGIPVEFRWVETEAELTALFAPPAGAHELQIEVKEPPLQQTVAIVPGQTIKLEGTSYELTIKDVQASWPMMTPGFEGAASPMASVDVKSAEKSYNRTVIQRFPALSQDIDEQGVRHRTGPYDENLVLRYRTCADGWITIAAGAEIAPRLGVFSPDGRVDVRPLRLGEPEKVVLLNTPLELTVRSLVRQALMDATPVIEPLERRRPNLAPRSMSAVRLTIAPREAHAGQPLTRWVSFSQYPDLDARPIRVQVAGGEYEIIYSRLEHELGATLIPRKLSVTFFPGRRNVESWRSDFLVQEEGEGAPIPSAVYTNQTCRAGAWTLFQSGAAGDHWSYTILGVGNRRGIWTMLMGCVLVTLGSLYAFYVKPMLIRRRQAAVAATVESANVRGETAAMPLEAVMKSTTGVRRRGSIVSGVLCALLLAAGSARAGEAPLSASTAAAALDKQIDWSQARLIAVQDDGRYKTLDSFARESMAAMYGGENLPGLSPMASLMEWLFNREAYADSPVIRIKDKGVRIHLSAHMPDADRQRIQQTGYMTPRELASPVVQQRIEELEPMAPMVTAMRRVRNAEAVAMFLERMLRIVPTPVGAEDDLWHTIDEMQANLPGDLRAQLGVRSGGAEGGEIPGVTQAQAVSVMAKWARLWKGWRSGEADKVQNAVDELAVALPGLAASGVYPDAGQRSAEATYYSWHKFTWGFVIYVLGMLFAVPAVVTRWRTPWVISLVLLVLAMAVHATGIGLRWFILGRIPVANMFEAIVGSAWVGIAIGLLVELRYRTRFALVGAHATGFLALVLAGFVVPGGGTITTIMGILDDVMLRIHTVLIISSYALIFLASVIAVIYLFGYYYHRAAARSAEFGAICAVIGVAVWLATRFVFQPIVAMAGDFVKSPHAGLAFTIAAVATAGILAMVARPGASTRVIAALTGLLVACVTLAIGNHGFTQGMAYVMLGVGALWALGNLLGIALRNRAAWGTGDLTPVLATAGVSGNGRRAREAMHARTSGAQAVALRKPLLAGALPGDAPAPSLPLWLQQADWCHLIILNMVFVMLFVGTILGAVWADYSWGRPWGWDPKEVFALNTWIIYAILIHARFFVKNKGLWTAWLSVAGCLMMAFNWCFVNFYIVGLHSYA